MDNWAKNFNFCDIQTDGHGNSMTDPARRIESVKMLNCDNNLLFNKTPYVPLQKNPSPKNFMQSEMCGW